MDGNRRWAKEQGVSTLKGHKKGAETFLTITDYAQQLGIPYVTVFAFSSENWSRTQKEVGYLMRLFVSVIEQNLERLMSRGSRLQLIGSLEGVDKKVANAFASAQEKTKHNTNGTLGICFNYGGQQEVVDAARSWAEHGAIKKAATVTEFSSYLYGGADIPPVDLIIRTSGEQRLSGFMLYRSAYAELYFTDTHWPAFTTANLDSALTEYALRKRRFGT